MTSLKKSLNLLSFLFLFHTSYYSQNIEWSGLTGGIPNVITHDSDGNIFVAGIFSMPADLDPGLGEAIYTPLLNTDMYVTKLSPTGEVIWTSIFQATNIAASNHSVVAAECDASGNIVLIGRFEYTVDFDPSASELILEAIGGTDEFVVKLNAQGNLVWAKQIGGFGPVNEALRDLAIDSSSGILLTGTFMQTIDLDPGAGLYEFSSTSNSVDFFILKLTAAGVFSWAKKWGHNDIDRSTSIALDNSNNIYLTGLFGGTVDFDPGTGIVQFVENSGVSDAFFLKLTSAGNFLWAGALAGLNTEEGHFVETENGTDVFFAGRIGGNCSLTVNGNSQPVEIETSTGGKFILKTNASGNIEWVIPYLLYYDIQNMEVDAESSLYLTGRSEYNTDIDPGAGIYTLVGNQFTFIQKLNTAGSLVWGVVCSTNTNDYYSTAISSDGFVSHAVLNNDGTLINHYNQDVCYNMVADIMDVADISCTETSSASVVPGFGLAPYTYSWNNSEFSTDSVATFSSPGIYTVIVEDANLCTREKQVLINGPLFQDNFDLNGNVVSGDFRPGFSNTIVVDMFNDGCVATSGQIHLVLNPLVEYNSAIPSPDFISGDTLTWNFTDTTYDLPHLIFEIECTTSLDAEIGDEVCIQVLLDPTEWDADPVNNTKEYCYPVVNGYDPNDKQVYPQGWTDEHFVSNNLLMTYTIRFQNTGNSEAINIHILDTIPSNLNLSTLRIVGSSHPMTVQIPETNVINFVFDNIMLPDSTNNEPESHGYVIFEIDQVPELPAESIIENSASIYFDFNEAVVTNTAFSKIFFCEMMGAPQYPVYSFCENGVLESDFEYVESYNWYYENESIGQETTLEVFNNVAGEEFYVLAVSNPLCIIVEEFTVNTFANPDVPVINFDGTTLSTDAIGDLQWYQNGEPLLNETGTTYVIVNSGTYGVSVTNENGCESFSEGFFETSITNPGDYNETLIFPNPANSQVSISFAPNSQVSRLDIYNGLGCLAVSRPVLSGNVLLQVEDWASGIYTVVVIAGNNQTTLKLLIH